MPSAISPLVGFVGHVERLSWNGFHQAERLQDVGELVSKVGRPLHKRFLARNDNLPVRRNVLAVATGGQVRGLRIIEPGRVIRAPGCNSEGK